MQKMSTVSRYLMEASISDVSHPISVNATQDNVMSEQNIQHGRSMNRKRASLAVKTRPQRDPCKRGAERQSVRQNVAEKSLAGGLLTCAHRGVLRAVQRPRQVGVKLLEVVDRRLHILRVARDEELDRFFPSFLLKMHEKRGNFCIFLLQIAEKEGKPDLVLV